ncbi:MAG: Gldg family protein, partial [bacterium]|nr:Gldg family protein [bacterium]
MASKKTLYHFHSLSRVLLIPAILVAANVLLTPLTLRWDLTANKQYTLGEASRRVLSELTQPVTVKIFFSRELPEELIGIRQDVHDLLGEYQRFGRGNLLVETLDPKNDQA